MRKRFKKTASGKLLRSQQGRRHILSKKTSKHKRKLARVELVKDTHLNKYVRMMGE